MRRDQRMPWGYNNGGGNVRPRMTRSPSPAVGVRRSASPAPRVAATRSKRSASPSSSRQPAAVLQKRLYRETREDTGMACLMAAEANKTQNSLETRVMQLENALRAEQEGTDKLYATLQQLRQDNSQLRDLANLVDLTKQGREAVAGVRRNFGAATPVVGHSTPQVGSIGIEEVPVRSAADPIPGASKVLLIGASYPGTPHELPDTDECIYQLQSTLLSSGFAGEYRMLDAATPATKQNILDGIMWLVDDAQPGDSLVFAFCGHSVQVTGAVSKLSGIAPVDWEVQDIISELDLKKLLLSALPAGVKLTCLFDLVGGGVGISMPNVLLIDQEGIKEDSDVVPSPSAAHVVTICNAWAAAAAPSGSLTSAFSTTLLEIGPEVLMADFLHSLAAHHKAPVRVGSSALELRPVDVFCFGVLPVHRGPRTPLTSKVPVSALPPPSASTPTPAPAPTLALTPTVHTNAMPRGDVSAVSSKALVVGSNATLVNRFLARQGFEAAVEYSAVDSFGEQHLRWLTNDAMPGDSMFLCMTCAPTMRLSPNDVMDFLLHELPQGVRLTWITEFEAPLTHPHFENYVTVTDEGLQHIESLSNASPLVMCVSGKTGVVAAYMAAMNRDSEPSVSHLATSIATIMASSSFDEHSTLGGLNIRLSSSKKWSPLSKMHLGLLPTEGKRVADVSAIHVDNSSLPPTPRMTHSKLANLTPASMPPISTPAAPAPQGAPGPVPVPTPIPASFARPTTPMAPATFPPAGIPTPPAPYSSSPPLASPLAPPAPPTSLPASEARLSLGEAFVQSEIYENPSLPPVTEGSLPQALESRGPSPKINRPSPKESQPSPKAPLSLTPAQENCKRLLVDFCSRYDASNLPDVETMLQDHAGSEGLLLEAVALRAGMAGYFTAKKKATNYYMRVNPEKVDQVDTILGEYVNAWDELFRDLEERYGEPFELPGSIMREPMRHDDTIASNSPGGRDPELTWRDMQAWQGKSPQRSLSPARSPVKLARPIQFDTTQDTIDPHYLQGTQTAPPQVQASHFPSAMFGNLAGPTQPSPQQLPITQPEDDLKKRRSDAEERYLALKEQTESYIKRVAALKDKPADAQPADILGNTNDWGRHM